MRLLTALSTVPPHVWIWARPAAQIAAIALMLSGCSMLDGISAAPSPSLSSGSSLTFGSTGYNPYTYYLPPGAPQRVQREYVDRYACASGAVLACTCTSRLAETCDCRC